MPSPEMVHRYPRLQTWLIEILCTVIVLLAIVNLGATVLRYLWDVYGIDTTLFRWIPVLFDISSWINALADRPRAGALTDLLPALGWTAFVLLLAILLRNAFPMVRTSSRGMLVEFAGHWLPVAWEDLKAIKVTSDAATDRFVLLVQAKNQCLTDWHRFYSLLYNLRWWRGFLITSNISEFNKVVRTILSESDRAARADENVQPVQLDEAAQSPLFRMLLSPVAFFSRRAPGDTVEEVETPSRAAAVTGAEPLLGMYPQRITALFTWSAGILTVLMMLRYLVYWAQFLALEIPALRDITPFNRVLSRAAYADLQNYYATGPVPFFGVPALPSLPAPWWLLLAAHLMIVLVVGTITLIRNLLPPIEARPDGLAVQVRSGWLWVPPRWRVVPWNQITVVKATEFSEENQILLLQTRGYTLPFAFRLSSLLYDGSFQPSVLVTSAMSNFEGVMQRVLTAITQVPRKQAPRDDDAEQETILQQDAESPILRLAFRPGMTIDQFVERTREDVNTKDLGSGLWRQGLGPMLWLALMPALFLLIDTLLVRGLPPNIGLVLGVLLLWFIGILEWPLVCLLSVLIDESTGGGEEGYRSFPLYPVVQLPRLLPMLGSFVLLLVGVPLVPLLSWIGAIIFSFFLAAGLWEKLYGWKGSQAILGGLIPVLWQFLVLLAYALVQR